MMKREDLEEINQRKKKLRLWVVFLKQAMKRCYLWFSWGAEAAA